MHIADAGLKQRPFHSSGNPVAIIQYGSEQAAHDFLDRIAVSERGIGLLHGPESSGKKTIIREFLRSMPADIPAAVVDARQSNTNDFLHAICSEFACGIASDSCSDCLIKLADFIAAHAHHIRQPLLIMENFDEMQPSALLLLCKLAVLKLQGRYAIRIILVSKEPGNKIADSPAMRALAVRMIGTFELGPMTSREAKIYLYAKLRVSGCRSPASVLPDSICDELYKLSNGWPGKLDKVAMQAIERATRLPIRREHIYPPAAAITPKSPPDIYAVKESNESESQKLYLTLNRETLQEFDLVDSKTLIGRSELCDITINSRFVSKYHALLLRTDVAMHLLDLKSTNGTFVNSRRAESQVLQNEDVISLGNHGIKLISRTIHTPSAIEEQDLADTAILKTLSDMRRLKAKASVHIASTEAGER